MLRGSIVSYASEVKYDLLGVADGPVVNEQAALEMAEGARRVLGSDVGLALTGVAGPDRAGRHAGRHVVRRPSSMPDGSTSTTLRLPGQREQMRQFSVISSLDLLRRRMIAGD